MLGAMMPQITDAVAKRLTLAGHILLTLVAYPLVVTYQVFAGNVLLRNDYAEYLYDSCSMVLIVVAVFSLALRLSAHFAKKEKAIVSEISTLTVGVFPVHYWIYEQILRISLPASPLNYSQICILYFVVTTSFSFAAMAIISRTRLKDYLLKI